MEKTNVSKWVNFLGIIAGIFLILQSMFYTFILFKSMISDGGTFATMIGIAGVCVDIGKIVTLSYFVYFMSKDNIAGALISIVFYLGSFGISMIASQSLDLNKANEIMQQTIIASDDYQINKNTLQTAQGEISSIKAKIDNKLQNIEYYIENDNTLNSYKQSREIARKNNWLTTPLGSPRDGVDVWDSKINKLRTELRTQAENEIKNLEIELDTQQNLLLTSQENLKTAGKNGAILTTEGLISFAKWLDSENPEDTLAKIYIFKNIFTELLGSLMIMLATNSNLIRTKKKTDITPKENIKTEKKIIPKKLFKTEKLKTMIEKATPQKPRTIGFNTTDIINRDVNVKTDVKPCKIGISEENTNDKKDVNYNLKLIKIQKELKQFSTKDKENIRKYLDEKEKNPDAGIRTISKRLKMTEYKVKEVFGLLKNLGILEIEGRNSKIVMNKKDYIKMLEL